MFFPSIVIAIAIATVLTRLNRIPRRLFTVCSVDAAGRLLLHDALRVDDDCGSDAWFTSEEANIPSF